MKGSARIIGSIGGRAHSIGNATAKAVAFGSLSASRAVALGMVKGSGKRTRDTGLWHWIQVTPTEPQHLVWLVPQVGIDYQIETSTNLHWEIK